MTEEPKRRGRPPKSHLSDEHHFRTLDDTVAAGAPPAAVDSNQADASDEALASDSVSADLIHEAVVENPMIALDVGLQEDSVMNSSITLSEYQDSGQLNVQNAGITGNLSQNQESPIEEKIHELVENSLLNGWNIIEPDVVLNSPPRNGIPIRLSEEYNGEGVLAFWKKERAFANSTKRWEEHGVWRDFYTGMVISFKPKYWKERF